MDKAKKIFNDLHTTILKATGLLARFLDPKTTNSEAADCFEKMKNVYHLHNPRGDLDPRWLTVLTHLRDLGARQGWPAMADAMLEMWQRYSNTREKP